MKSAGEVAPTDDDEDDHDDDHDDDDDDDGDDDDDDADDDDDDDETSGEEVWTNSGCPPLRGARLGPPCSLLRFLVCIFPTSPATDYEAKCVQHGQRHA